jgi:tetratricopeptide (TPR) repeat protein
MTDAQESRTHEARSAARRRTFLLSLAILLGLGGVAGLNRWLEVNRPPTDPALEEEKLYVTGAAARRMSLGFNGLIADWYWMRSLQYVGRKVIKMQEEHPYSTVVLEDFGPLKLKLLYPLLDTTTTLDPQFLPAYEYGALVLPVVSRTDNDEDAIALLKKGIAANPNAWKLYHYLGYIHWQRKEYELASEAYSAGARLPGAPKWMEAMVAQMKFQGNDPETARAIYERMYEQADDPQVKNMVKVRLWQIDSVKEREVIRRILSEHQQRTGQCASSWQEVARGLQTTGLNVDESGAPLDPAGTPYRLVKNGCDVDLNPGSKVPYK